MCSLTTPAADRLPETRARARRLSMLAAGERLRLDERNRGKGVRSLLTARVDAGEAMLFVLDEPETRLVAAAADGAALPAGPTVSVTGVHRQGWPTIRPIPGGPFRAAICSVSTAPASLVVRCPTSSTNGICSALCIIQERASPTALVRTGDKPKFKPWDDTTNRRLHHLKRYDSRDAT